MPNSTRETCTHHHTSKLKLKTSKGTESRDDQTRSGSQRTAYSETVHSQFTSEILVNRMQSNVLELFLSLDYSAIANAFDSLKHSKERQPDVNWRYDEEGNTLLHIFTNKGNAQMVSFLLDLNCNIDIGNSLGRSPLHLATLKHNKEIIDLLLASGANINSQDNESNTPLMLATIKEQDELVEYFLVHNADITLKNRYSQYACDMIRSSKILSVYQLYIPDAIIQQNCTSYSKVVLRNPLLNYSRREMIEKLLYKSRVVNDLERNSPLFFKRMKDEGKVFRMEAMKIKEMIGKGGFATVHKVTFDNVEGEFALKVMKKDRVMDSKSTHSMVLTERSVLEKVHSPFIVNFYKAFQSSSSLYLLLEYLPHGDLKSCLTQYPHTLNEEEIKMIAAQLILAIEHLHKQKIMYRDLKPENILIDKEGYVKLTDFGLCKENSDDCILSHTFCGTIAYLSPDVFKKEGYNRSIDWYNLGVVLYEMICGSPPFYSPKGKEAIIRNILHAELTFKDDIVISCYLKDLIRALMQRDSDKRLGNGIGDADDIKAHPFFKGLNFNSIYNKQFVPSNKLKNNKGKAFNHDAQTVSYADDISKKDFFIKNYLKGWDF